MPRYALSRNPIHGTHYVVDMTGGQALTENQMRALAGTTGTALNLERIKLPHGVVRSLVVRGLLRWKAGQGYRITPEGHNALATAMRATPTRLSREHEDKSRAEKTLAHYNRRGHEHFLTHGRRVKWWEHFRA